MLKYPALRPARASAMGPVGPRHLCAFRAPSARGAISNCAQLDLEAYSSISIGCIKPTWRPTLLRARKGDSGDHNSASADDAATTRPRDVPSTQALNDDDLWTARFKAQAQVDALLLQQQQIAELQQQLRQEQLQRRRLAIQQVVGTALLAAAGSSAIIFGVLRSWGGLAAAGAVAAAGAAALLAPRVYNATAPPLTAAAWANMPPATAAATGVFLAEELIVQETDMSETVQGVAVFVAKELMKRDSAKLLGYSSITDRVEAVFGKLYGGGIWKCKTAPADSGFCITRRSLERYVKGTFISFILKGKIFVIYQFL